MRGGHAVPDERRQVTLMPFKCDSPFDAACLNVSTISPEASAVTLKSATVPAINNVAGRPDTAVPVVTLITPSE